MAITTDIFGIDASVTQVGILGEYRTSSEIRIRFVIENAGGSSQFSVYGRIKGQTAWNAITTLTANEIKDVTVAEYDFIMVVCDVYSSLTNNVHFLASGIAQSAGGLSTITAGGNVLTGLENVTLESVDSSITFTSNTGTGVIDLSVTDIAAVNTKIGNLITLSGVATNADDLGTFTGSIIPDNSTNKVALQSLETSIDNLPDPMEYKGLWSAATNTPTLTDGGGNNGDVYQVTADGTVDFGNGSISFVAGDKAVYNGATAQYEKWDMTDAVSSVNGYTGAVSLVKGDISLGNVDNTSDATKDAATATLTNKTLTSPIINTPSGIVKGDVGLANVDNTSDENKPVSIATQTALDAKVAGPASATNNAVARYDSTTGKIIKDSLVTVDNSGNLSSNTSTVTSTSNGTIDLGRQTAANSSSGLITGGITTINVDPTKIDISAGEATLIDIWTDPTNPKLYNVSWAAKTAVTVTYLNTNTSSFIGVDKNGDVVQFATNPTNSQRRDVVSFVRLAHRTLTSVTNISPQYMLAGSAMSQLRDLIAELKFINSGNIISANGANLSINKSTGNLLGLGLNYTNDIKDPNKISLPAQVGATFQYRTQTGTATANITSIVGESYDDGGTVTAIGGSSNQATNQRVYIFPSGNIRIQYGQTVYSTLSAAISASNTEQFITFTNIVEDAALIGILSVTKGATDLSDRSEAAFLPISKLGEFAVGSSGFSTTTLEQAYLNSTTPEIITNSNLGALSIKRGSSADTDNVLEVQNGAGTNTLSITGNGLLTANNFSGTSSGTNTGDQTATTVSNAPAGNIAATTVQSAINELDTEKEPTVTATTSADYYRGDKTFQTLDKTAVGLSNVDNTSDATKNAASVTLTNKTIDASSNTISNLTVAMLASGVLDTDISSTSGSDDTVPSAKAVKSYVDTQIGGAIITGDISPTAFSAANNQAAAANVTGFAFASGVVRTFQALVSVSIVANSNLYESFSILGLQKNGSFDITVEGLGDNSGIVFTITSGGQLQYTSTDITGFVSSTIKFRAINLGI
jgi:hypothetical protein